MYILHTYIFYYKNASHFCILTYCYNHSYFLSLYIVKPQLPSTPTEDQPQPIEFQLPSSKPKPPPVKPKPPKVKPKQPPVELQTEPQAENHNPSKSANDGMLIMLTNTYVLHMY